MSDIGNLQLGDIEKKKEALNKTGGINTSKSVFNTKSSDGDSEPISPYMTRVEELGNYGPLMQSRIHTQNSNDIAMKRRQTETMKSGGTAGEAGPVEATEQRNVIKAPSDLREFTGTVMKKGTFTPKAKEAAKHFFKSVSDWAGSFNDGGSGFYRSMGIEGVLDCLYVDGMSLRNYVKEQFLYKGSGDPVQDKEMLKNYVALLAARGEHVLTMVRPSVKGQEAGVEFRKMDVDLTNVGSEEAAKSRTLKEKGNQVRSNLKKRLEKDYTEQTGMAFRKAEGYDMDGFNRIEGAKKGLKDAGGDDSEEYKSFNKLFERYNGGLQKLGLKPGRDDINAPVAEELKKRCEEAIKAADLFITSNSSNNAAVEAVKKTKKEMETDRDLLDKAIKGKLIERDATMKLEDLLDSRNLDDPKDNNGSRGDDNPDGGDPAADDAGDTE